MMSRAKNIASAVIIITTMTVAATATAGGAAAADPAYGNYTLNDTNRVLHQSIIDKIVAGRPSTMTPDEVQELLASEPLDSGSAADHPTNSKDTSGATANPLDVNRCNLNVCIEVQSLGGSGPFIIEWNAQWYQSSSHYSCDASWYWWGNFTHYRASNFACGYGSDYTYWTPYRVLASGAAQTYYLGRFPYPKSREVNFSIH
jgi:hypothetical protein